MKPEAADQREKSDQIVDSTHSCSLFCREAHLDWPGQAGVAGDPGSSLLRSPGRWMSCEALVKHISKVAQPTLA